MMSSTETHDPSTDDESSPLTTSSRLLRPFYSDSSIQRDRKHVLVDVPKNLYLNTTKFVLQTKNGMLYNKQSIIPSSSSAEREQPRVQALYFTARQVEEMLSSSSNSNSSSNSTTLDKLNSGDATLAWLATHNESDFWLLYSDKLNVVGYQPQEQQVDDDCSSYHYCCDVKPLREFGDRLESTVDAGILATANGLAEFHKSHPYCSQCGSKTTSAKVGACRMCVNCNNDKKTYIYPRIDVASIMLITSACGNYGLLGRKKHWPQGRYSTLAGFAEVGETIEDCCIRETLEESGVVVDPASLHFVASQPWPFPRSLMVGFQAKAFPQENGRLPEIHVDQDEMEDIQWFHRDFVKKRLEGGSTALSYNPTTLEKEFHIPGRSSLARLLISRWATAWGKEKSL